MSIEDVELSLLDDIGETIIPTTDDIPGAKATRIGEYMIVMVKDCFRDEQKKLFIDGLNDLDQKCATQYNRSFQQLAPDQKLEFLGRLQEEALNSEEKHYFDIFRSLTISGYFTSEIGMVQARAYEPIPGRYIACMPLEEGQKPWAI
ncbi:gluconate 2-dehydrogenase subunit 3 family protein [Sinomicrobium sp. M5D2P17]